MNRSTVAGLLGTLVVAAVAAAGLWAFAVNYVVEEPGALLVPTGAALAIAAGFVFVLFVLGARSDRWMRNPYW